MGFRGAAGVARIENCGFVLIKFWSSDGVENADGRGDLCKLLSWDDQFEGYLKASWVELCACYSYYSKHRLRWYMVINSKLRNKTR